MEEWRQLLVDVLVEGINSSSLTGAILQDTFQLAEAGLYWIFPLSRWIQLTTSNGQPRCSQQQQTEPRSLHYCDRGELLPQNLGLAFLGPQSLQSIDTSSKDSSWKHVLYIEPFPTIFRPTLDLLKVASRLKCPVFHHHHALQTTQLPIGWRNILGAAGVSYWWTQKQDIIERNP